MNTLALWLGWVILAAGGISIAALILTLPTAALWRMIKHYGYASECMEWCAEKRRQRKAEKRKQEKEREDAV